MSKMSEYRNLVAIRKQCNICRGMKNPSETMYDSYEIGPWSMWQNSLTADIMVVGQDWGDVETFEKQKGWDHDENNTNLNLMTLLKSIGICIAPPSEGVVNDRVFLTNAVLCMKSGGMSAKVNKQCYLECGRNFLSPLIEIVKPKVVVAMGIGAYNACAAAFGLPAKEKLSPLVDGQPINLNANTKMYVVYHCGPLIVKTKTRSMEEQLEDWAPIKKEL